MTVAVRFGVDYLRNAYHLTDAVTSKKTLCGRPIRQPFDARAILPGDRSCESCLRISERRHEREQALLDERPLPVIEGAPV